MSFDISRSGESPLILSSRQIKELKDTLHKGQIVQGVVKEVLSDNKYVLQINGVNTIGHTEIPLSPGQTFFAGVKDMQDKVILSFMTENEQMSFLQDDLTRRIKIILSQLNLKADALALSSAEEFIKSGMVLGKDNLISFLDTVRSEGITDAKSIRTAVLLYKNGLPVTRGLVEGLQGFFGEEAINGMLSRSGGQEGAGLNLSQIVNNISNIISGLKDILSNVRSPLDSSAEQIVLKNFRVTGSEFSDEMQKEVADLLKNSGLSLEGRIKDAFMGAVLSQEDLYSSLQSVLKMFHQADAGAVAGEDKSSLLNYGSLSEALATLKKISEGLSSLLEGMPFSDLKDILARGEDREFIASLKDSVYRFMDGSFSFFSELRRALEISGKPFESLPESFRQMMPDMVKALLPFLDKSDLAFLGSLGAPDIKKALSEAEKFLAGGGEKTVLNEKTLADLFPDMKNMLMKFVEKLESYSHSAGKETLPGDSLSQELRNAGNFVKESLLEIMREQVSMNKTTPDFREFQVTVPFMEGNRQRELNVYFRKESSGGNEGKKKSSYSVVIFLELSQIGDIRIDLQMAGNKLECSFFSREEGVVMAIGEQGHRLVEAFKKIGVDAVLNAEKKDILVEEKAEASGRPEPEQRDFYHRIDIRV
jgi:hypothetical protein